MSPPKRRPWIRLALLGLLVTGVGLLAGTATGRMQVYRALFTIGSDKVQAWAAERMGQEPPEAALPVIFGLQEEG